MTLQHARYELRFGRGPKLAIEPSEYRFAYSRGRLAQIEPPVDPDGRDELPSVVLEVVLNSLEKSALQDGGAGGARIA